LWVYIVFLVTSDQVFFTNIRFQKP
jgi:hypothetical protein